MKVLLVSADGFEDSELLVPYYRFLEEGIEIDIASIKSGPIIGKHGYHVVTTCSLNQIDASLYDVLILPGGKAPTLLRKNEKMLALVRQFFKEGKTVAAICHGPLILVSAGVLSGRRATCYKSVAEELEEAGCSYSDEQVVVDDNLITSRVPADIPAFMREIMKKCRKPTGLGKKKLALIHIVKRELHLSDQETRNIATSCSRRLASGRPRIWTRRVLAVCSAILPAANGIRSIHMVSPSDRNISSVISLRISTGMKLTSAIS